MLCAGTCGALGQAGGGCGVVVEKEGVANGVAGLLEELGECLRKRGGILSAEKQHAIVDVDQTSSVVAALWVLGAGDDDLEAVSAVGEESTGIAFRRGWTSVHG